MLSNDRRVEELTASSDLDDWFSLLSSCCLRAYWFISSFNCFFNDRTLEVISLIALPSSFLGRWSLGLVYIGLEELLQSLFFLKDFLLLLDFLLVVSENAVIEESLTCIDRISLGRRIPVVNRLQLHLLNVLDFLKKLFFLQTLLHLGLLL